MKIAYFDCFSGISGDMIIGALLDAGLKLEVLREELKKLPLRGYKLKATRAHRGSLAGTRFEVIQDKRRAGKSHWQNFSQIRSLLEKSDLEKPVIQKAIAIFRNLCEAESKAHGTSYKHTHLHEVGELDSIIDVVGAVVGIDKLKIEEVYASLLPLSQGSIHSKAGRLPLPAPATLYLLKGMLATFTKAGAELVTPTGAAILKTLTQRVDEVPPMRISAIGYGAGSRAGLELPNLLRLVIGEKVVHLERDSVTVIETNLDDMNPINYEILFEKLFNRGALDVFVTPVHMKKSRPGELLTVLAEKSDVETIVSTIFEETPSFGLRFYEVKRRKLSRTTVKVKTKFGSVRLKVGRLNGRVKTASPEYEDCKCLAEKAKAPFRLVYEEAKRRFKV